MNWPKELLRVLWYFNTTQRATTRETPFSLVYRRDISACITYKDQQRIENYLMYSEGNHEFKCSSYARFRTWALHMPNSKLRGIGPNILG